MKRTIAGLVGMLAIAGMSQIARAGDLHYVKSAPKPVSVNGKASATVLCTGNEWAISSGGYVQDAAGTPYKFGYGVTSKLPMLDSDHDRIVGYEVNILTSKRGDFVAYTICECE